MGKLLRICLTLAVIAAGIAAGTWVWNHYLYSPWTRDGRIRARVITLAPDVSGWVNQLAVADNQSVKAGELLFTVDPTRYQAAINEQKAEVENKRYAWELAQHQYRRRQTLNKDKVISSEDLESSRINTQLAKANYDLALATLKTDEINLQRTRVSAPADGTIVNLSLRQGNYVSRGTPVMSMVEDGSFYVTGYFEETKLPLIHLGQQAHITLMSGNKELTGTVSSIGRAIADDNTTGNSQLLPEIQQTFNWVRLAQRIPVDIRLDELPENTHLSAGMTVSISLDQNRK